MWAREVDLTDGHFYADGYAREAYRWMRKNNPIFRDSNGLAAATTYSAIVDAERNPKLFSNAGGIRPERPAMPHMIDMDDPEHLLRRRLVNTGFTRKRVQDKSASIRLVCDELIDAVCDAGVCDFVDDIAALLPMAVIGDMLGVQPEDRAMLLKWSDDMLGGPAAAKHDPAALQVAADAFVGYAAYMQDIITQRRKAPTNDLFSALVNAEVDNHKMSDDEIIQESLLILIGGDETTRHALSSGVEQLLRHREQWERLRRDPSLVPGAVEEMLRWSSPVKNMCRTLTADADFYGTPLHAGEKIMLLFESGNFDEAVFGDPDDFRIDRKPNHHLAFGFGTHFCMGNQLARLELSLMLTRLLARLPDLRLASDAALPLRPVNFVSGVLLMPVVFAPSEPLSPRLAPGNVAR